MRRFYGYEPIPFYFFNDEFNRDEIIRQLDLMQDAGIKAFYLHVRDGIITEPWGTDRFCDNMKFIIEEAIKRDIKPWLYDEDSYPSGQGGGKIAIDRPELRSYGLIVRKIPKNEQTGYYSAILGKVKGLYGYAVKKGNGSEVVRIIDDCFGPVRRRWYRRDMSKAYYTDMSDLTFKHIRAVTCYTEIMFEAEAEEDEEIYCAYLKPLMTDSRYGTMTDCLNIETTKEYISRVYEKYKKVVGKYFGKEIPGIFMDEPSIGAGLPFTAELPAFFKKRTGYDFFSQIYKLSSSYKGQSEQFRRDYVESVKKLFIKNFIKPIKRWCKNNNLLFTGHYNSEEDPLIQALYGNDVYENVSVMDIPGFDVITTNIGDVKHPSLIMGGNLVASSAAQNGKNRVLAECFALSPYNMGYNGLKRCTDWLVACGINFIVPHGFHYGYNAYQRADAGKSFFFQDPLFPEYIRYSHYAGRLCKIISEYDRDNDTLIVLPDGAFAEEIPFPIGNNGIAPSDRAISIRAKLYKVIQYLITHHTGFDLTETEHTLNAKFKDNNILIGKKSYNQVIVIEGGEKEAKVYEKINGNVNTVYYGDKLAGLKLNDNIIKGDGTENLLVYTKKKNNDSLIFIFNNSEKYIRFKMKLSKGFVLYDAEKDLCKTINIKDGLAEFSLQSFGSLILERAKNCFGKADGEYELDREKKIDFEYLTNPQLVYSPENCVKVITHYDLTVNGQFGKKEFKNIKFDRLRNYIGTQDEIYRTEYVIPYMDTAPRPQRLYPVSAEYTTKISGEYTNELILFDGDSIEGKGKIYFNGERIAEESLIKRRLFDIHNYCFKPKWKDGDNELKIVFEDAGEFDGIGGEIFIIKG